MVTGFVVNQSIRKPKQFVNIKRAALIFKTFEFQSQKLFFQKFFRNDGCILTLKHFWQKRDWTANQKLV